jgi:hypothetical protein
MPDSNIPSDEYEVQPESMATLDIGEHTVYLLKAKYPDRATLDSRKWHAYCVEYFGDHIHRSDRVLARADSFYVAGAKAVDAYGNSLEQTSNE